MTFLRNERFYLILVMEVMNWSISPWWSISPNFTLRKVTDLKKSLKQYKTAQK